MQAIASYESSCLINLLLLLNVFFIIVGTRQMAEQLIYSS